MTRFTAHLGCLFLVLAVACGGDDDGTSPAAATPSALAHRPCTPETKVGEFRLEAGDGFTAFSGHVATAVVPIHVPRELLRAGDCRLLERRDLDCQPACSSEQTCGERGACIPYPTRVSVGQVSLRGLARPLELGPSNPGNRYFDTRLPHPGFAPGAALTLQVGGAGDVAGFSLAGRGVAPLQTRGSLPLRLERGKPLALGWTPGGPASRVQLVIEIDQHGITPATLECDVADTGAATVPAELLDRLIEHGVSGDPNVALVRRTADSTTVKPGCVEFLVMSQATLKLDVPASNP